MGSTVRWTVPGRGSASSHGQQCECRLSLQMLDSAPRSIVVSLASGWTRKAKAGRRSSSTKGAAVHTAPSPLNGACSSAEFHEMSGSGVVIAVEAARTSDWLASGLPELRLERTSAWAVPSARLYSRLSSRWQPRVGDDKVPGRLQLTRPRMNRALTSPSCPGTESSYAANSSFFRCWGLQGSRHDTY